MSLLEVCLGLLRAEVRFLVVLSKNNKVDKIFQFWTLAPFIATSITFKLIQNLMQISLPYFALVT